MKPSRVDNAKRKAADLVEKVRLTERAVVLERTLAAISGDQTDDELREGIERSIAFSPWYALMLAREALPRPKRQPVVY